MTPVSAPPADLRPPTLHFTLKIISRCNLNCSYCYVYHKADQSWRDRPAVMPDAVFIAALARIQRHCEASGQDEVRIVFHGGEPCMIGKRRFARWCRLIRRTLDPQVRVILNIQTNGTLIDADWAELFAEYRVGVGVSIDGSRPHHDRYRVDHFGKGSYDEVCAGIAALRHARLPISLLSVINFEADPLEEHRHLLSFEPRSIDYLFPDASHDDVGEQRARFGPTPCADYLIPIFDHWNEGSPPFVEISPLRALAVAVLGGRTNVDFIGNEPYRYLFVEADGAIEGLDVLRICEPNLASTGLNVLDHDFVDLMAQDSLHRRAIFDGLPLPGGCAECPEATTCAGGYLPHRYARGEGFDHPSAWCDDLYKLARHIRGRLSVTPDETLARRGRLNPEQGLSLTEGAC